MYASMHDVFSYRELVPPPRFSKERMKLTQMESTRPACEEGDETLVQQASVKLSGGHSQYISNVHLDSWESEEDFWERLYPRYLEGMLGAAKEFCRKAAVGGIDESEKTLIMISAGSSLFPSIARYLADPIAPQKTGFDASEFESSGMSRHRRNVPTSFYHRFSLDVCAFANEFSQGRILAVLEGGYSDRALASGSMAMMVGLAEAPRRRRNELKKEEEEEDKEEEEVRVDGVEGWWNEKAFVRLEKACKPKRGGKLTVALPTLSRSASYVGGTTAVAGGEDEETWIARAVEVFSMVEGVEVVSATATGGGKLGEGGVAQDKSRTMQLRERRPTPQGSPSSRNQTAVSTPAPVPVAKGGGGGGNGGVGAEEVGETRAAFPKIKFTFKAGLDPN